MSAPASAATDGANIGVYPAAGTTFVGTLAEDFPTYLELKPGLSEADFSSDFLTFKVERTAGFDMDVIISASGTVATDLSSATSASSGVSKVMAAAAAADSSTFAGIVSTANTGVAGLNFAADTTSAAASWSKVTLAVTAWIDSSGGARNDVVDADEWFTTFTVTLLNPLALTGTLTMTQPYDADTTITISGTVTGLNTANLSGHFFIGASSSDTVFTGPASVFEAIDIQGPAVAARGGVVSASPTLAGVSVSDTISAALRYSPSDPSDIYSGYLIGSVVNKVVAGTGVDSLVATVVASDHSTASGQTAAVRPNQTYTIQIAATTNSTSVSSKVISIALSGTGLGTNKMISVNGAAATSSYPAALTATTNALGFATFTVGTTGFENGNTLTVIPSVGNQTGATLTLTATTPAYSIVNDYDIFSTTPGTAVTLGYEVQDQWQVKQSAGQYRIQVTRGGTGFSYGTTVSEVAVTAGVASFAFTPSPATKTGSATVGAVLQKWDSGINAWVSGGSADGDITVTVTSTANGVSVSPVASYSSSISYFPSTVSWTTVTGEAKNAGSSVTVTGADNLIFRSAAGKATTSGAITVRAGSGGSFTFDVASTLDGTHTMSVAIGSAVTTSLLVIDPAAGDAGKAISFDISSIAAGSTATITGTLVDMNGNPVDTTGSATITVVYAGKGIAIGTMPTETNADGEFTVNVLVGNNDSGTATLTAVYNKNGASTAAADKLTVVHSVTIGVAAEASADQKITVGTFKGYVAIYTKGYMGQKLSAKVAGKWLVVDPIAAFKSNDYSRTVRLTGAGYTITVDLYIDGAFVRSEVVTTK
ncbi:MAG: hypothetical protein JXR02_05905 [Aquiluna sp.]